MEKLQGIYQIRNIANNEVYVGSSTEIRNRWRAHRNLLRKDIHENNFLQAAWNKYGESNFIFEIIEIVDDESLLIEREQFYIDTFPSKYNLSKIAGRVEMTEERKAIISAARIEWSKTHDSPFKGRKHTQESRNLISKNHADISGEKNYWYGKKLSDERKDQIRKRMSGENHPFYGKKRPDHAIQISGENNYFYGKLHTEEFKKSSSLKRCKLTPEQMLEVVELHNEGFSQKNIAKKFNCSFASVNRIIKNKIKGFNHEELKIDCIKKKNMPYGENNVASKVTWDIVDQIRTLRNIDKLPLKEIAEKFNVSVSKISSIATFRTWIKLKGN